jgi:hypothetical protein
MKAGPSVENNSPGKSPSVRHGIARKFLALGASSAILVLGLSTLFAAPSYAAGTSGNTISVGSAPSAGSDRGTYTPQATATSKDVVAIALSKTSTGCSLSGGKITFTGSGECVITFNDPGNTTYAAAAEVTQYIKVYSANTITVSSAPAAGSARGSYSPGASATSGDAVVRSLASDSSGCTLSSDTVTFTGAGTCRVHFNDAGNGAFAAASEVVQTIDVHSANVISTSAAPSAGTINGTYHASASATSKDVVSISLDGTSTGCSIYKDVVTFTANGYCRVDFNDAGNGAFAGASQVQQTIIVGTGGPKVQGPLYLTSLNGTMYNKLTLTSEGGSGTGAVSYTVTTGSAGCVLSSNVLSFKRVGTCTVTVTKAADSTYLAANSAATTVTVNLPKGPHAVRVSSAVWTGRVTQITITGTGFYGQPKIVSNIGRTRIGVSGDNGKVLVIRVSVEANAPRGVHTFILTFAHGDRTAVLYNQR